MKARINWSNIHPTIRQVVREANVSAVTGKVTDVSNGRVQLTWQHDNDGDETDQSFWFDVENVVVSEVV